MIAQLAGSAAATVCLSTTVFRGPVSSVAHGADFSVIAGVGVGALLYWLLARRRLDDM